MPKVSRRKTDSGLEALQRAITGALMKPLNADESMAVASRAVAEKFIKPNDRLTAFERLQIYNQQYWWRLLGAFAEDFRGVRAVLGERKFDKLATAYLEQHGSTSWTLRNKHAGCSVVASPPNVLPTQSPPRPAIRARDKIT